MSNSLTDNVRDVLRGGLAPRLVVTTGNTFRSDDGVGPYIAERLKCFGFNDIIDAGQNPEDVVETVIQRKPASVVVLDAASFGGRVGEARVIEENMISQTTLSTHQIPLSVVMSIIREETGAEIRFIGIQCKSFALGEGICDDVKAAADEIVASLL